MYNLVIHKKKKYIYFFFYYLVLPADARDPHKDYGLHKMRQVRLIHSRLPQVILCGLFLKFVQFDILYH